MEGNDNGLGWLKRAGHGPGDPIDYKEYELNGVVSPPWAVWESDFRESRTEVPENGVILRTRLTSAGTRVYFYRTYLFGQEEENGAQIADNAQESFSEVGHSSRKAGPGHQPQLRR